MKKKQGRRYRNLLAGEITKDRYEEKHSQLMSQKTDIQNQLDSLDVSMGLRLEQSLVSFSNYPKKRPIYTPKRRPSKNA